jgi:hypothetical protein
MGSPLIAVAGQAVLEAAMTGGGPFGEPDEAEAGAVLAVELPTDPYRIPHRQVQSVPGVARQLDGDHGVGRVLAGVRQALLDDAEGAAADRLREGVEVLQVRTQRDVRARRAFVVEQRVQVTECRLWPVVGDVDAALGVPEQTEDLPEVGEGALRIGVDDRGGLSRLGGAEVGPVGERPGMDGDQ